MKPEDIEACVDAAARALDLPIAPEHRPGVLQYFALAAGFADLVNAHPLTVHDDPATTFVPVEPGMHAAPDAAPSGDPAGGGGRT